VRLLLLTQIKGLNLIESLLQRLKKWVLSKHDSEKVILEVEKSISKELNLPKSSQVTFIQPKEDVKFATVDEFVFLNIGSSYIPFLGSQKTVSLLPSVFVDQGAIKYILNGADVMRPGIVRYDEWGGKDILLSVREVVKERAIAIGLSLVESSEMEKIKKGACVKNIHYVGDRYWNVYKLV
jgi:PUA domain protein